MCFSALILIVGLFINFENPMANNVSELLFSLIALNAVFFGLLWLKNYIILTGFILYLVSFNFDLLFNPLITGTTSANDGPLRFLLNLDIIATGTVIVGIFGDNYFKPNIPIRLTPTLLLTIAGTVIFQFLIRTLG